MEHEKPVVKVRVERVYGKTRVYPICENAKAFARIAGDKAQTISKDDIEEIKRLGFEIEIEAQEL